MKSYDVKCPICGRINYSLYLEETDGWMECESCGNMTRYPQNRQSSKQIPLMVIRNLHEPTITAY